MQNFWDLDQALAWVVWRDRERADYLINTIFRRLRFYKSSWLSRGFTSSPLDVGKEGDLLHALREGVVSALGMQRDGHKIEVIPFTEWQGMVFGVHGEKTVGFADIKKPNGPLWTEIRIPNDVLMRVFPSLESAKRNAVGRPNVRNLVSNEYQRRKSAKTLLSDWNSECINLEKWAKLQGYFLKSSSIKRTVVQEVQYKEDCVNLAASNKL